MMLTALGLIERQVDRWIGSSECPYLKDVDWSPCTHLSCPLQVKTNHQYRSLLKTKLTTGKTTSAANTTPRSAPTASTASATSASPSMPLPKTPPTQPPSAASPSPPSTSNGPLTWVHRTPFPAGLSAPIKTSHNGGTTASTRSTRTRTSSLRMRRSRGGRRVKDWRGSRC